MHSKNIKSNKSNYLTINWGMYVCLCVCLSVCLSVCPAIRFHSSQRIFSKFGEKPSTGHDTFRGLYILCVHATRAQCARINRVCMLQWRSMKPIIASGSFIVTVY
jgi:hypothetical protein